MGARFANVVLRGGGGTSNRAALTLAAASFKFFSRALSRWLPRAIFLVGQEVLRVGKLEMPLMLWKSVGSGEVIVERLK
jgi:hypothetical protein